MSKRSKRMLSLLLGAGLVLSTPAALAWSWNQYQARPYNGFESYSPGYGSAGYGYQPAYPQIYRRASRPYYYGYRPQYRWPGYGYCPNFPGYRYYRRHQTSAGDAKILTHLGLSARAPPRSPHGHSTDSNGLIPAREPPPIRFNSLSRQPPLPCTRVTGQNAPDPGASDR